VGDRAPLRTAPDVDAGAVDRDVVEGRDVDGEAAGDASPRAVAAAADHDLEPFGGGVAQCAAHVVDTRSADDGSGLADAGVEAAGGLPVGVARTDDGSGDVRLVDAHRARVGPVPDIPPGMFALGEAAGSPQSWCHPWRLGSRG
jgi:hypothetical protein